MLFLYVWVSESNKRECSLYTLALLIKTMLLSCEGEAVHCCSEFGKGSEDIHIRNVECSGPEENITSCTYYNVTVMPSHEQDVGVRCQQG